MKTRGKKTDYKALSDGVSLNDDHNTTEDLPQESHSTESTSFQKKENMPLAKRTQVDRFSDQSKKPSNKSHKLTDSLSGPSTSGGLHENTKDSKLQHGDKNSKRKRETSNISSDSDGENSDDKKASKFQCDEKAKTILISSDSEASITTVSEVPKDFFQNPYSIDFNSDDSDIIKIYHKNVKKQSYLSESSDEGDDIKYKRNLQSSYRHQDSKLNISSDENNDDSSDEERKCHQKISKKRFTKSIKKSSQENTDNSLKDPKLERKSKTLSGTSSEEGKKKSYKKSPNTSSSPYGDDKDSKKSPNKCLSKSVKRSSRDNSDNVFKNQKLERKYQNLSDSSAEEKEKSYKNSPNKSWSPDGDDKDTKKSPNKCFSKSIKRSSCDNSDTSFKNLKLKRKYQNLCDTSAEEKEISYKKSPKKSLCLSEENKYKDLRKSSNKSYSRSSAESSNVSSKHLKLKRKYRRTSSSSSEEESKKHNMKSLKSPKNISSSEDEKHKILKSKNVSSAEENRNKYSKKLSKKCFSKSITKTKKDCKHSESTCSSDSAISSDETSHSYQESREKNKTPAYSASSTSSESDDTTYTKKQRSHQKMTAKRSTSSKPSYKRSNEDDDLLRQMNNYSTYTSRDLVFKKPYKLLDIKITEESGFNGMYKQATGTFKDTSKEDNKIIVRLPKPIANYTADLLKQMKKRIANNNNPRYVVNSVGRRDRADGKGSYDIVDFKWV